MFKSSMRDLQFPGRRRLLQAALGGAAVNAIGWPRPASAQNAAVTGSPVTKDGTVLELQANAPDRYTVQRGDTLWDISNKFLKEPWRWPEFWRFNAGDIRNPHLIYPGQVLSLDRFNTRVALAAGDERVRPRVRVERGDGNAIPSIPANVIEPWLSRPLVIAPGALDNAPRILIAEEGRYNLGPGGRAYVRGVPADNTERAWQIVRLGRPLIDPETREILGTEVVYVGQARLIRNGDAAANVPSTIIVERAQIEVTPGDRLVPAEAARLMNYMPRAPQTDIRGQIISIYGGRGEQSDLGAQLNEGRVDVANYDTRREAGPLQVISLNRGTRDGVELGHVLSLHRSTLVRDERSTGPFYMGGPRRASIQLPEERYGLVFVFRAFERVSYGLIVQALRTAVPGDLMRRP